MSPAAPDPFLAIGENVHASRTCARRGQRMDVLGDEEVLRFVDAAGAARTCPIAAPVAQSEEYARQRVKHIKSALLLGLAGDDVVPLPRVGTVGPAAVADARAYLVAAAVHQERAGARYVDINVDDVDEDPAVRSLAMAWLVCLLESELGVPLSLDSSSPEVLEAGLRASRAVNGPVLLNSASGDRLEVLNLAAELGAGVILSAMRGGGAAPGVPERLACAEALLEEAFARGLAPAACHVDLLVIPAGIDCEAGRTYLQASRAFRAAHEPAIHITGGLSNISFGLPRRQLLNDTFVALALDAGVDSGILDPLTVQLSRVRNLDRESPQFRIAAGVILGKDEYAAKYLAAYRAGRLAAD